MKICLIEDDSWKSKNLKSFLVDDLGLDPGDVLQAQDLTSAAKILKEGNIGLALIDCRLPERFGDEAEINGGLKFVRSEIMMQHRDKRCEYIATTGYRETFESQLEDYGILGVPFVFVEETETRWKSIVSAAVDRWKIRVRQFQTTKVDALIVVAIEELEMLALQRAFGNEGHTTNLIPYSTRFFEIKRKSGDVIRIAVASLNEMGPVAAACATSLAVSHFSPRVVISAGICGGIADGVNIGDLVVAEQVWNRENGKVCGRDKLEDWFAPEMKVFPIHPNLILKIRTCFDEEKVLEKIATEWAGERRLTSSSVRFGPVACSSAVIGSSKAKEEILKRERKTVAVEMEAYGVCKAAERVISSGNSIMVIKGVSDLADSKKSDSERSYAAHCMAIAIREILISSKII